jgi:hypothetical protein
MFSVTGSAREPTCDEGRAARVAPAETCESRRTDLPLEGGSIDSSLLPGGKASGAVRLLARRLIRSEFTYEASAQHMLLVHVP